MTRFQVSKISGPGCGTRKSDGSSRRIFQVSRNEGSVFSGTWRQGSTYLSSDDEDISGLENIGTWIWDYKKSNGNRRQDFRSQEMRGLSV